MRADVSDAFPHNIFSCAKQVLVILAFYSHLSLKRFYSEEFAGHAIPHCLDARNLCS